MYLLSNNNNKSQHKWTSMEVETNVSFFSHLFSESYVKKEK